GPARGSPSPPPAASWAGRASPPVRDVPLVSRAGGGLPRLLRGESRLCAVEVGSHGRQRRPLQLRFPRAPRAPSVALRGSPRRGALHRVSVPHAFRQVGSGPHGAQLPKFTGGPSGAGIDQRKAPRVVLQGPGLANRG